MDDQHPNTSGPRASLDFRASLSQTIAGSLKISRADYYLLGPALLFLVLLVILPFSFSVWQSLVSYDFQNPQLLSKFAGLDNYRDILSDGIFYETLLNTARFTAGSVLFELPLGLMIALYLQHLGPKVRRLLLSVLLVPTVLAPVAVGLMWKFLINPQYGVVTFYLRKIGLSGDLLLADPGLAPWAVRAVEVWQWTPFSILFFQARLSSIPIEFLEAAAIDGLSRWLKLRYLILPYVLPSALVALLLRLIEAFKVFDTIFILTGGGPAHATETVTLYANRIAFVNGDFGRASADIVILNTVVVVACRLLLLLGARMNPLRPRQGA